VDKFHPFLLGSLNINKDIRGVNMKKKYLPLVNELDNTKLFRKLKEINKNLKEGVFNPLESEGITISEKADSVSCRFGINEKDELFFESERCDEEEKEQAVSFIRNNKLLEVVLKNMKKDHGPVQFEAEFFPTYNHEFNEENRTVFNAVPYHKDRLGEAGAFVVYDAKVYDDELGRWNEMPDNVRFGKKHFAEIKDADCKHCRVYTSEDLKVDQPIGLSVNLESLREYFEDDEMFERGIKILNSGWKTPEFLRLKNELNQIKEQLNNDFTNFAESSSSYFGSEFPEGYVINVGNGPERFSSKINTSRFNEAKDFNWSVRTSTSKIVKECYKKLKREVLQLGFRNSSTINEIIKKKMGKIEETNNDETYIEAIGNILESVVSPDATFDGIKENAQRIIYEAENSLAQLEAQLDEYDYSSDVRRKTVRRMGKAKEVISKLKNSFVNNQLEGYEYLVSGFMEVFNNQLNIPERPVKEKAPVINIVKESYKENCPKIYKRISNAIWSKE